MFSYFIFECFISMEHSIQCCRRRHAKIGLLIASITSEEQGGFGILENYEGIGHLGRMSRQDQGYSRVTNLPIPVLSNGDIPSHHALQASAIALEHIDRPRIPRNELVEQVMNEKRESGSSSSLECEFEDARREKEREMRKERDRREKEKEDEDEDEDEDESSTSRDGNEVRIGMEEVDTDNISVVELGLGVVLGGLGIARESHAEANNNYNCYNSISNHPADRFQV